MKKVGLSVIGFLVLILTGFGIADSFVNLGYCCNNLNGQPMYRGGTAWCTADGAWGDCLSWTSNCDGSWYNINQIFTPVECCSSSDCSASYLCGIFGYCVCDIASHKCIKPAPTTVSISVDIGSCCAYYIMRPDEDLSLATFLGPTYRGGTAICTQPADSPIVPGWSCVQWYNLCGGTWDTSGVWSYSVSCCHDGDCEVGGVCDTTTHKCVSPHSPSPSPSPSPTPSVGDECIGEGTVCSDGNPCHSDGYCSNGYCIGTSNLDGVDCSEGDPCQSGVCSSGSCSVVNEPDNTICGDGRYCVSGSCSDVELCENSMSCSAGKICSYDGVCLLPSVGVSPNWAEVVLDITWIEDGVEYRMVIDNENVYITRVADCIAPNNCSWIVRPLSYYDGADVTPDWSEVVNSVVYYEDGNRIWNINDSINAYYTNVSECTEAGCVWEVIPLIDPGEAYWANMNGQKISEAEAGDSVMLIRNGGGSGDFVVKEDDIAFDEEIISFSGEIEDVDYIAIWTVEYVEDGAGNPEFYFEVEGETSNSLTVSEDENDDPMIVEVISPRCGDYFDEGQEIEIEVIASDSDDVIDGEVDIDGEKVVFSNGKLNFDKRLDMAGNLQIIASSVNGRGKKSRSISNIMVLDKFGDEYVDGNYVAACISEPKDFGNIIGNFVKFNASATRGIKVIEGERYLFVPGEDRFSWHWSYYGPGDIEYYPDEYVSTAGEWAYVFNRYFPMSGDNSASLEVDIGSSSGTKI